MRFLSVEHRGIEFFSHLYRAKCLFPLILSQSRENGSTMQLLDIFISDSIFAYLHNIFICGEKSFVKVSPKSHLDMSYNFPFPSSSHQLML
jgi:hypothetical protein